MSVVFKNDSKKIKAGFLFKNIYIFRQLFRRHRVIWKYLKSIGSVLPSSEYLQNIRGKSMSNFAFQISAFHLHDGKNHKLLCYSLHCFLILLQFLIINKNLKSVYKIFRKYWAAVLGIFWNYFMNILQVFLTLTCHCKEYSHIFLVFCYKIR